MGHLLFFGCFDLESGLKLSRPWSYFLYDYERFSNSTYIYFKKYSFLNLTSNKKNCIQIWKYNLVTLLQGYIFKFSLYNLVTKTVLVFDLAYSFWLVFFWRVKNQILQEYILIMLFSGRKWYNDLWINFLCWIYVVLVRNNHMHA